jgi:diguanylate cyclase (GGDEF)-like protein
MASAVALVALVATLALDGPAIGVGAWMAIAVGLTAVSLGPRYGAGCAAVGLGFAWAASAFGGTLPGPYWLAELAAVAFAAWAAGSWARSRVFAGVVAAEAGRRRGRLLAEATLALEAAEDPDSLLAALPALTARVLDTHHASTLRCDEAGAVVVAMVPPLLAPGTRVAERSIVGRAARTDGIQLVPDARRDPDYFAVDGLPSDVAELAVPLHVGERVHAVLNVERPRTDGFDEDDKAAIAALARVVEIGLERFATLDALRQQRRDADRLAELSRQLAHAESARTAASIALATLADALVVDGGTILHVERGSFRPLAVSDGLPTDVKAALEAGLPWGRGRLHEAWQRGTPRFDDDYAVQGTDAAFRAMGLRALASVPVRDTDDTTIALIQVGSFTTSRVWSDGDRRLLGAVASTLGAVLARITVREREAELLEVVRQLADAKAPADLYQRVVEAAVRVVPGAEAGTLVVRTAAGGFVFDGVVGFDGDALRATELTAADQFAWYGRSEDDWLAGRPRVLTGDTVGRTSAATGGATAGVFAAAGRASEIRASLCVPIALQQEVLAALNLDAFSRDDAFGPQSIAVAQSLAYHAAVIVRQAQDRAALARSAITDPLTGLGNREAFNRALARELHRARRYEAPVALAMLDLDGFKRINDTFGHAAGDSALVAVAAALVSSVRSSDEAFRWGGDEFVVIMPQLEPTAGSRAAERLVAAISGLEVQGLRLGASVGLANYPGDGVNAAELLRRADDLLYEIKGSRAPQV